MEPSNSFFKNSRNQKRKDDKYKKEKEKRHHSNKNESWSNTESKPQRTNIKQSEKQTVVPTVADDKVEDNNTDSPITGSGETQKETGSDTEEIEKLADKNYKRRQITSNWEKYSVPETEDQYVKEDESEAADFGFLLQVPQSFGGHLKLKEEKNWAAESEAILNSYLALDLNLLAQGLACIPFYQRHQLSEDLFLKEDLEKMHATTIQNEELYKFKKDVKTKLKAMEINDKIIKIILEKNKPQVDALGLTDSIIEQSEKVSFTNIKDKSDESKEDKSNKVDKSKTLLTAGLKQCTVNHSVSTFRSVNTSVVENTNVDSVSTSSEVFYKPTVDNEILEDVVNSKNSESETFEEIIQPEDKKSTLVASKSQVEDDEELDFLLSLKEPVKESNKTKKIAAGTSVVVHGVYNPESITKPAPVPLQESELDDWLNSVLED